MFKMHDKKIQKSKDFCLLNFGKRFKMNKDKRGLTWQELVPWIIGIAVLAIVVVFAYMMKDQLVGWVDHIKSIFRGG